MYFYVGSEVSVEWTNQHGLNNHKLRSSAVLQYMCEGHTAESGTPLTICKCCILGS